MGLINSITDWNKSRQEKHMAKMEANNHCPQCYGRGFHAYVGHEYTFHGSILDCPGCSGTGLYSDWSSIH